MAKKVNYLSNKRLLAQLEECNRQGKMTDEFATSMLLLVNRIGSKGNFAYYSYNEEMRGDALVAVCRVWSKFNAEKSSNPFSYFTQIINNSFIHYLNKEKRHQVIRDKLLIANGLDCSASYEEAYREEMKALKEKKEKK